MDKIDAYLDYREYLRDYYEWRKRENAFFSYRVFGRIVGMDGSLLAKVLLKQRHISEASLPAVAKGCGLKGREADYFEVLVRFGKARTEKQSKLYFERLLELRKVPSTQLDKEHYRYYTRWYYSAIRSCLEYFDFRGDYVALARHLRPEITVREAKEGVELLTALGLIRKEKTGRYRLTTQALTTGEQWRTVAVRAFQEETLELARQGLDLHDRSLMDISTITMAIRKSDLPELRERIKEFRTSIVNFVHEASDPSSVYHMNIQLLPLTTVAEEESK